jgi:hypothetical protein
MAQPYYTEIPMLINDIPIADANLGNPSELYQCVEFPLIVNLLNYHNL